MESSSVRLFFTLDTMHDFFFAVGQALDNFILALGKMLGWEGMPPDFTHLPQIDPKTATATPVEAPATHLNAPIGVSAPQKVYNSAKASLGQKLTLNPSVDPEVGCAEAVSTILKQVGYAIPQGGIPSVNGLIDWMLNNHFRESTAPLLGCIITAHRADRNDPEYAHVGIVMKYGIASNDSRPQYLGQFRENYQDVAHWVSYYNSVRSVTRYFVPV